MTSYKKYFLLTLFFCLQLTLMACSCVFIETFCETTTFNSDSTWADLIVYGEKISEQEDGMEVKVLSLFHGIEDQANIFINKGNGANCGENTSRFNVGEQFIFALVKGDPRGTNPNSYWLSICGVNFLKIEGTKVVGPIAPDVNEIPINEFHTLSGCGLLTNIPGVGQNHLFRLFPNPANNSLHLEWEFDRKVKGSLKIFDSLGRLVNKWSLNEESRTKVTYDISRIPAGLYFIEVNAVNRREAFKILVQQ